MARSSGRLQVIVLTPPGLTDPSLAIAASRAGETGVLDLEYVQDEELALGALGKLVRYGRGALGVKLSGRPTSLAARLASEFPAPLSVVILTYSDPEQLGEQVRRFRKEGVSILLECVSSEEARVGEGLGVDGLIAKGQEAGGRVGEETTFVLLQRLLVHSPLPVWAQGGIGLHTAAACYAGGAAGIVLDSQLYLTRESPLGEAMRSKIAAMDGSETVCVGEAVGERYRIYSRPGLAVVSELQQEERKLAESGRPRAEILSAWRQAVGQRLATGEPDGRLWLLGQDAAFAAPLTKRFSTVAGVLQGISREVRSHTRAAQALTPLAEGAPLAASHGTRYPIVQGPMTRVSDVPAFAAAVAEGGALPFAALALMRGPDLQLLLEETRDLLKGKPWGVGILGFVPLELREEQLEAIRRVPPPFALIAGGRPDQARKLEQDGIPTYLHVPSPGLLRLFLADGAKRFVFEGSECGGHVGPRASFVLWESMMEVLLEHLAGSQVDAQEYHVLFAGGVHDSLSGSMVAAMAAPLAERGARIGVLMGTAYIFTKEAVASGAILPAYQDEAIRCSGTALLETGPGHSTRCIDTAYVQSFREERQRLTQDGKSAEEIRLTLEELNLGRLRMASKGIVHADRQGRGSSARFKKLSEDEQRAKGMYMIGQVAALRDGEVTIRALHHDVAAEGSKRLGELQVEPAEAGERASSAGDVPKKSGIAIIGMSCFMPKASNLGSYWNNILNKVSAITEVPLSRWDWRLYYDEDPRAKDKMYSKWGGFIDDIPFDPMSFGMPPSSLPSIEPMHLLALEAVRAALKDADYLDREFDRERVSVILGAGGAGDLGQLYGFRSFLPQMLGDSAAQIVSGLDDVLPQWTEDSFAGILTNVAAGRIANRFDLGGVNYTVDAACASSLAAVQSAVRELEMGTSDMVIVGGADTIQSPFAFLCFSKTFALSASGQCRPFDEKADGIVISEGVGILILKRLPDAERDGDRIYAVIKSVGGSSDGRDKGLTAPRPEGQVRALRRAYAAAGVSPATVGLIEAHGTGTVAGDQAELQSLSRVFEEADAAPQACAIGSVKSMIGHTKNAAGVAGLIKTAMALNHRVLPPTFGVEKPTPKVDLVNGPLYVNTELRPWIQRDGGPRRAGVSAFGFGGTNFHVVLEEYDGDYTRDPAAAPLLRRPGELMLFARDSRQELIAAVDSLEEEIGKGARPELSDLAFTLYEEHQAAKASGQPKVTLAVVASSLEDLRMKLSLAREHLTRSADGPVADGRGVYISEASLAPEAKVAFLFPGQSSQYVNMLMDLVVDFPEVQDRFEAADRVLMDLLPKPLSEFIFPPPAFSPEEADARLAALTQTNVAQPAIGVVDLALFHLLQQFGVRPDFLAGHSYGEYVALCAAGFFSEEELLVISEARGRFIVEAAGDEPGGMIAAEAGPEEVEEVLTGIKGAVLANHNAPKQVIISGSDSALEQASERFKSRGVRVRPIPVACAFHSPKVAPSQKRLAELLNSMALREPSTTVFSNTTATVHPRDPRAISAQLVEHLVRPVRFVDEINAMYEAGARIFVEVGPRNVLTGLTDQILGDRPHLAVATDQPERSTTVQLLHVLGRLATAGVPVKLDRLFRGIQVRHLDMANLPREAGSEVAPGAWLVNGGRAKPPQDGSGGSHVIQAKQAPSSRASEVPATEVPRQSAGATAPTPRAEAPSGPVQAPQLDPTASALAPAAGAFEASRRERAEAADAAGTTDLVMSQFQQLMRRFLDTQQDVMLTYLRSRQGGSRLPADPNAMRQSMSGLYPRDSAEVPAAVEPPQAKPPSRVAEGDGTEESREKEAAARVEAVPPVEVQLVPGEEELTLRLRQLVSERTGYPLEMLDLDLDLEADLGIDSIKRVEILGNYQREYALPDRPMSDADMEKLTAIRTMRGIVEWVMEYSGAATPVAGAPGETPQTPAPGTQPGGNGSHTDTGAGGQSIAEPYPPDMGAVPPSQVQVVPGREDLTLRLRQLVSERTGYPLEMLDLDLDLEADLGIDSIKRVEILGNYQREYALPDRPMSDADMEKLTAIRTLRGIVEWVMEYSGAATSEVETVDGTSAPSPEDGEQPSGQGTEESRGKPTEERVIYRYTSVAAEAPAVIRPGGSVSVSGLILITEDERGVARALADELAAEGNEVVLLRAGGETLETAPGCYTADLISSDGVAEVLSMIRERHGPIGALVHLLPLKAGQDFSTMELAAWRERVQLDVKSLFHLAQQLRQDLERAAQADGACVMAATAMGGAFGTDHSSSAAISVPSQGGVAGLVKTLGQEWPGVRVKVVDLDLQEPPATLGSQLLQELGSSDGSVEVGYAGGRRLIPQLQLAAFEGMGGQPPSIDSSSVLLLTGGARGITAEAALHLARLYRPTLLLLGRSPLPDPEESADTAGLETAQELKAALIERAKRMNREPVLAQIEAEYRALQQEREIRRNLSAMKGAGANVHYFSVDVRDEAAFGGLVDRIYDTFGGIDGVIHGAGVIEDKLVKDKSSDSFDRVLHSKVDGAFILSRKLRPDSLKFLVFFSSAAAKFGNRGQADYTAANEVLNKLALHLDSRWPGRVVSVNWGPWKKRGMVSGELEREFAERGIELIPVSAGSSSLDEEIRYGRKGEAEVFLTAGGWRIFGEEQPAEATQTMPMLDGAKPFWNGDGSLEVVRKLDPAREPYLRDHQLNGKPVLAMAVATELMAEIASLAYPELRLVGLRDLQVLQGIVLENGPEEIRIVAKPQPSSSDGVKELSVVITRAGDSRRLHYRAVVEMAPSSLSETPDVPRLNGGGPFPLGAEEAYRKWLFQGPAFQGLRAVHAVGADGIAGSLAPSSPRHLLDGAGRGDWLIDPVIIDSGLQLLILWSRVNRDETPLPSGFRAYRWFRPLAGAEIECHIQVRSSPASNIVHADLYFVDDKGVVLGVLEDLEVACSKALNRLTEVSGP